ncbi:MAG TPA: hypothetical protein VNA25_20180 [Phycisphaerae bacterium]|nr:hypothetical protein [Phycisphaerae bacterium]
MRRIAFCILIPVLSVVAAQADVVYLRNGQKYEGKATTKGDKVLIETRVGTFELDAADVLHIARTPVKPEPSPATSPAGAEPGTGRPISAEQATQPESVIFILMRNLAGTPPGTGSYAIRQQIERWRIAAHDRKRRVGTKWVTPDEFARRRQSYAETLKEAEELLRKVRYSSGHSQKSEAERKRELAPAISKLQAAAGSWPDPLIRNFLSAVAQYQAGNYTQAEALFRRCAEEQPLVAAFRQGRALSLVGADRALPALAELIAAMDLRPDSRELVQSLQECMKKVPGARIKDPLFVRAQEVLSEYPDADRTGLATYGVTWLMPGKDWRVRGESLPVPPYDRMVFRQALGVPIAKNTLLLDADVVKNAQELFVQIDSNTFTPALVRRTSMYAREAQPLLTVSVRGYEFTPPPIADANYRPTDNRALAYGLVTYSEMQVSRRKLFAQLGPRDANGAVTATTTLGPGEAAGPVFAADGTLVGFMAAKTDVGADGGGPDRFIPISKAAAIIKRAASSTSSYYSGFGRAKRNFKTRQVAGSLFVVHGIIGEKLE